MHYARPLHTYEHLASLMPQTTSATGSVPTYVTGAHNVDHRESDIEVDPFGLSGSIHLPTHFSFDSGLMR